MADTDAPPTVEQVVGMCQVMNGSHGPDAIKQASEWLERLQSTVHAWSLADQLLHQKHSLESCYFAANTMRHKIQTSFLELPAETHTSLRDSLMSHLRTFGYQYPVIITQLSLAMADLAVYLQNWPSPLSDVLAALAEIDNHLPIMLEFVTVLPEEVDNHRIKVTTERRRALKAELCKAVQPVFQLLLQCLSSFSDNADIRRKILDCIHHWMKLDPAYLEQFVSSPLYDFALSALREPALQETAKQTLSNAIFYSASVPHIHQKLLMSLMSMRPLVAQARRDEDEGLATVLAQLYSDIGESVAYALVCGDVPNGDTIVECVLECCGYPAHEVITSTFGFFYTLSDVIYDISAHRDDVRQKFQPVFLSLYQQLFVLSKCEADQQGIIDDNLFDFRSQAYEQMLETSFIISSTRVLAIFLDQIRHHAKSWMDVEAALFMMQPVAHKCVTDMEFVPHIIKYVTELPKTDIHVQVQDSAVRLLCKFDEWLGEHGAQAGLLQPVFDTLLAAIQVPDLTRPSCQAIRSVSTACASDMTGHLPVLVQVLQSAQQLKLTADDVNEIVKSASRIVAKMDLGAVPAALENLCGSTVVELETLVSNPACHESPKPQLERLAQVFRYTNIAVRSGLDHPCWPLASRVWVAVQKALSKYVDNEAVVEKCMSCLKWLLRCVGSASSPIVNKLVPTLVHLFKTYRYTSCLYLSGKIIEVFAREQQYRESLMQLTMALAGETFQLLQQPDAIRTNPDVVDDFFRLTADMLKAAPWVWLSSDLALPAMHCAIECLSIRDRDANETVAYYVRTSFACVRQAQTQEEIDNQPIVEQKVLALLEATGQPLVNRIAECLCGGLPAYMIPPLAEVLYELIDIAKQPVMAWLHASPSISRLPFGHIGQMDKDALLNGIESAREFRDVNDACRNFARLFED